MCWWCGHNPMCVWFQTAVIPCWSQYYFICKAWDGNHRQISAPTLPNSSKQVPILEENRVFVGLFWLAKKTCMCGCRLALYCSKVNISSLKRFMKPGMGIIDTYLLQPYHFLLASPHFEGTLSSCWSVLAKKTCVVGCRTVLYYFKVNISSLKGFMKTGIGIIDGFLLQPH